MLHTLNINDNQIIFVNNSRSTRNGFAHDSELYINDNYRGKHSCHYLNRTWERYRYQTVMVGLVSNLIEERKNYIKADYKRENNIARLTQKHAVKMAELFEADDILALYRAIIEELKRY
jgi:hypothetical protein